jgi:hypothetical protein
MLTPASLIDFEPGWAPQSGRADSLSVYESASGPRVVLSGGRLYRVPEASGWGAQFEARVRAVPVYVGLSRLGGELYEERAVSLGGRIEAGDNLVLKVRARVLGMAAGGIDDRWTLAVDAGMVKRFLGRVLLGASCENFAGAMIGNSPVAARTAFVAALDLTSVSIRWTLLMEEPFAPASTLGFEASLTNWLRVRAGVRDEPGRLGFGIGLGRRRPGRGRREGSGGPGVSWPTVDLSVQWHPRLGVSSFVSVTVGR